MSDHTIKTVSVKEALTLNLSNWDKERLNQSIKTRDEVREFMPCETTVTLFVYDSGSYDIRSISNVIQATPFVITVDYREQYKKYMVFPDFTQLKNVDSRPSDWTYLGIKAVEPNQIGKLSLKKLSDWIAYYTEYYNVLKQRNDENAQRIADFRKSIEGLPVKWWDKEQKRGELNANGINLEFTISHTGVSQNLKVDYRVNSNVENFLMLADNKMIIPSK